MSENLVRFEFLTGTVVLPRGTGQWVQDPDGWWRELFTDIITLDHYGREVSRKPCEGLIRMSCAPYSWLEPEPRWRRLLSFLGRQPPRPL